MIVYFADRRMNILGIATTSLRKGYVIEEDLKAEEVDTGVATFSCTIGFDADTRAKLEEMTNAGNYLLRSHDSENEFYTIIDTEIDTRNQTIYVYAEDAGLDLINEIVGDFAADDSYNAEWYINRCIADSGFEIGINEIPASTKRKLSWDGEATVTARLASIATQFGGYEISYSFDIKGLEITNKYINIHKERGKDEGVQLRLNREIDRIVTTKSVANLATAFVCEGGVPDNAEEPITFSSTGYTYKDDDDDFFVDGNKLKSKKANAKWSRYIWNKEPNKLADGEGYIVKPYSYDTTNPDTLRAHAMTELKKVCDMEVNYEIDIKRLPAGVKIGDRINIVDDAGEMYVSTRVLMLETSIVDQKYTATLGEHLIKTSGISQKVIELADQFAKAAVSVTRAMSVANSAYTAAVTAKAGADRAYDMAVAARDGSNQSTVDATAAVQSSSNALAKAEAALEAVAKVEESVSSIETTVENAKTAADNAEAAAETALAKAEEAKTAASNAAIDAAGAKSAAGEAKTSADSAISKADTAIGTANDAKEAAENASETAQAAKADAEQAEADIAALSGNLETLSTTMQTDYARKTELTETEARLQSQITQNAGQITSTVSLVATIDETANDAKEKAEAAQTTADSAQSQANQATADAKAAQDAADAAATAAANAQSEADTAKAAADAAQSVADKAEADLTTAKADLATVSSRVDATEEEITAAQAAVETAQSAADKAKTDADAAAQKATEAQTTANTAVTNAANAKAAADDAASKATAAQKTADEAKGDASAAQTRANEAASAAAQAQETADAAVANAAQAQSKANQAAADAATAQQAAADADAKAAQAQTDLNTAKQNLADVTSRVDATEEEVEAAQAAVVTAQEAADKAAEEAEAAQATADTAKANAATAQTAANNAKTAADNAQSAANAAKAAADKAQEDVDALAVRVVSAETKITQNSEQIALMAKKTEVAEMLGGYSTKEETAAAIQVKADAITSSVSSTYATKQEVEDIEVGGRNLLIRATSTFDQYVSNNDVIVTEPVYEVSLSSFISITPGKQYVFSRKAGSGDYFRLAWYDAEQTYIDRKPITEIPANEAGEYVWTAPETAYSLRVSYPTALESEAKCEEGNKATDWTPAPEDVDSSIADAQSTADQASESATSANERITTAESLIQQLSNCIAMLVTDENGESLMTQTENGWTFSMKETSEAVASLISSLEALQEATGSTQATVDILQQAVSDHGATLEYVKVSTYEDEPCIELGESDSDFKLLITNTRIMFMKGANVPTYINTHGLVTQNLEVKGEIVQGGYVMLNTSDGGWGLLWKGVSE